MAVINDIPKGAIEEQSFSIENIHPNETMDSLKHGALIYVDGTATFVDIFNEVVHDHLILYNPDSIWGLEEFKNFVPLGRPPGIVPSEIIEKPQ